MWPPCDKGELTRISNKIDNLIVGSLCLPIFSRVSFAHVISSLVGNHKEDSPMDKFANGLIPKVYNFSSDESAVT